MVLMYTEAEPKNNVTMVFFPGSGRDGNFSKNNIYIFLVNLHQHVSQIVYKFVLSDGPRDPDRLVPEQPGSCTDKLTHSTSETATVKNNIY